MLGGMIYVKNVPGWERWVRGLLGFVVLGTALALFGYSWLGLGFGIVGIMALMTGLIGFCPICALAGRRLDEAGKR